MSRTGAPPHDARPTGSERTQAPSPLVWVIGLVAAGVSTAASGALAFSHFASADLPGCGENSGCAEAANSVWGSIPGLGYPVSLVGAAYFLALLIGWGLCRRHGVPLAMRLLVHAGALASLFYVGIMLWTGLSCVYCIVAHVGNFIFWANLWVGASGSAAMTLKPVQVAAATFGIATIFFTGAEWQHQAGIARDDEEALQGTLDRVQREASNTNQTGVTTAPPTEYDWGPRGFTGRYTKGPKEARIRIVLYSDYQCPDCFAIERQVAEILAERDDVSFSPKHFPFCNECNYRTSSCQHPNACYAAQVAEAAGKFFTEREGAEVGAEMFFTFHEWLFSRRGNVGDQDVWTFLEQLGYSDTQTRLDFMKVVKNDFTLGQLIESDITEAYNLGLHYTPMVFVNGIELKGFRAPNALKRMVEQIDATDPTPAPPTVDDPPLAFEKLVADWRAWPRRPIPPDSSAWSMGDPAAPVQVVLFGGYQEEHTARADALIRRLVQERGDIHYTVRHFPGNKDCNPHIAISPLDLGCVAARAAEAVGQMLGDEAFWNMHRWLMANQSALTEQSIINAAVELGVSREQLLAKMASPEVAAAIAEDADAGDATVTQVKMPMIWVNERHVPRWDRDDLPVLETIIDEAARQN